MPKLLKARLYLSHNERPKTSNITTEQSGRHRYPSLTSSLGGSNPGKPRAVRFTVFRHGVYHHFVFFFRNWCHLPINRMILRKFGVIWRGNVVVMRESASSDAVVALRSGDIIMVDHGTRQSVISFILSAVTDLLYQTSLSNTLWSQSSSSHSQ